MWKNWAFQTPHSHSSTWTTMQTTSSLNSIISNEVAEEKEQRPWLRPLQWEPNWNAHKARKNNSSSGAQLIRKMLSLTGKAKLQVAHTGFVSCSPKSLLRVPVTLPHRNMQAWSLSRQTYWIPKDPKTRVESYDPRRPQVFMVGEEETGDRELLQMGIAPWNSPLRRVAMASPTTAPCSCTGSNFKTCMVTFVC